MRATRTAAAVLAAFVCAGLSGAPSSVQATPPTIDATRASRPTASAGLAAATIGESPHDGASLLDTIYAYGRIIANRSRFDYCLAFARSVFLPRASATLETWKHPR